MINRLKFAHTFDILVSNYDLEEFFNRTNDQMTRITSYQETNPAVNKTLADKKKFVQNRIFFVI